MEVTSGAKVCVLISDPTDTVRHKITPKINGRSGVKCPVRTVWSGRPGEGASASWSHPSNGAIPRMSDWICLAHP